MICKKHFIFFAIVLVIINFIASINCQGSDEPKKQVVFYDGVTLHGLLNNGDRFEATITKKPFKSDVSKSNKKYWGTDGGNPKFLINKFTLNLGGSEVKIPDRAIEDLANIIIPGGIYLMQKGDEVIFIIEGGDGAGAYDASLVFLKNRLISRTISFVNSEGELDSITKNY